jgi:hypothetical protein
MLAILEAWLPPTIMREVDLAWSSVSRAKLGKGSTVFLDTWFRSRNRDHIELIFPLSCKEGGGGVRAGTQGGRVSSPEPSHIKVFAMKLRLLSFLVHVARHV